MHGYRLYDVEKCISIYKHNYVLEWYRNMSPNKSIYMACRHHCKIERRAKSCAPKMFTPFNYNNYYS